VTETPRFRANCGWGFSNYSATQLLAPLGLRQVNPLRPCTAARQVSFRRASPPSPVVIFLKIWFSAYPPLLGGVSVRLPAVSIRLTPSPPCVAVQRLGCLGGVQNFLRLFAGGALAVAGSPCPPAPASRLLSPSCRLC